MRVLVTDGANRAALAITRSLGRAGHHVVVGEKETGSLAATSRYCAEQFQYEDPLGASGAFIASVAEAAAKHRIDVLVPVSDVTTFLITRHRARFGSCAIPFAPADVVERAANKVGLMETAARLGVPTPRSAVVACASHVPEFDFGFPVVVKPWQSRVLTGDGWQSTSVSYAQNAQGLVRDLAARQPYEFPVMVQERITGPGVGVFACYQDGKAVALFSHRRIRERPPWGGVSVLAESTSVCPLAGEYATRLLDDLGWAGVAMVEFKRDTRDGVPKLMEINGRFWGSLQLAIDAGVDFPRLLVEGANGRTSPPSYRLGVRTRWFWGDVDSLLVSLFGTGVPPHNSRRLAAAVEFLRLFGRDLHYDNPKWFDPQPFVTESLAWFRRATRDAVRRARADK